MIKLKISQLHTLNINDDGTLTLMERKSLNTYLFLCLFFVFFIYKSWISTWIGSVLIILTCIFYIQRYKTIIDINNLSIKKYMIFMNINIYNYFKVTYLNDAHIVCEQRTAPGDDISIGPTFYCVELFSKNLNNKVLITKFASIHDFDTFKQYILKYTIIHVE